MILRLVLIVQLCLIATPSLHGGIWERVKSVFVGSDEPEAPKIRVLVLDDVPFADLNVKGTYNLYDPYQNSRLATRFSPKGNRIRSIPAGLKWGEEFPGVYQIMITPDEPSVVTNINGVDYKGEIIVYDIGGSISIVNVVTIEDYLDSIMPVKHSRTDNIEALAAISIAERTHALYVSQNSTNSFWHVKAPEVGYRGLDPVGFNRTIHEALSGTRQMVLSKTGVYEGVVTPYPVCVVGGNTKDPSYKMAKISTDDIELMAQKGDNAAKILSTSFPNTSIELVGGEAKGQVIAGHRD